MQPTSYRDRLYHMYKPEVADASSTAAEMHVRGAYLRDLVLRHFPKDRTAMIVDLGCGGGALIHFAREAGYQNVSGVDRSPSQIAIAKSRGIAAVQELDLLEALHGLPDKSQDVIITLDVIEHFLKDELIVFADEVARVLRPGGRWIIHVPNGESPFGAHVRYGDFTHELAFTQASLRQFLFACDFSGVHCYEDTPIAHNAVSLIRRILWKSIRIILRFYVAVETGERGRDAIFTRNLLAIAIR